MHARPSSRPPEARIRPHGLAHARQDPGIVLGLQHRHPFPGGFFRDRQRFRVQHRGRRCLPSQDSRQNGQERRLSRASLVLCRYRRYRRYRGWPRNGCLRLHPKLECRGHRRLVFLHRRWIQCDGYAGYSSEVEDDDGQTLVAVPDDRRLGCGMHIRSKFHAALLAKDKRAAVPLKFFADLYLIEAECKADGVDAKARGEIRRMRSLPILDKLDAWVYRIHPSLLPKSPLRWATTYAINQRLFFRRCFSDGAFEIDNGRTERRIRNYAVGRRNFLFTGSVRGGERLAV